MDIKGAWKPAAVVLVALSTSAAASAASPKADAQAAPANGWHWFSRWFDWSNKENKKQPNSLPNTLRASKEQALAREHANYCRRMDVCLQLRQIAQDTHDDLLQSKVEQLEKRVWEVCQQRLKLLGGVAAPSGLDQQILDRHLSSSSRALELHKPLRPFTTITDLMNKRIFEEEPIP